MAEPEKGSYGKRPLWQWVLIYLVIGAVVYGAVYYVFLAPKGGYTNTGATNQNSTQSSY